VKRDIFKNHWQLSRRIACEQTLKDFTTDPQDSDRPTSLSCDLTLSKDPQDRPTEPLSEAHCGHLSPFSLIIFFNHTHLDSNRVSIVSRLETRRNASTDTEADETRIPVQNTDVQSCRTRVKRRNSYVQSCEISFDYRKILQSTL
jgi:hypothetical protein